LSGSGWLGGSDGLGLEVAYIVVGSGVAYTEVGGGGVYCRMTKFSINKNYLN
jgi:hypothetical protein